MVYYNAYILSSNIHIPFFTPLNIYLLKCRQNRLASLYWFSSVLSGRKKAKLQGQYTNLMKGAQRGAQAGKRLFKKQAHTWRRKGHSEFTWEAVPLSHRAVDLVAAIPQSELISKKWNLLIIPAYWLYILFSAKKSSKKCTHPPFCYLWILAIGVFLPVVTLVPSTAMSSVSKSRTLDKRLIIASQWTPEPFIL